MEQQQQQTQVTGWLGDEKRRFKLNIEAIHSFECNQDNGRWWQHHDNTMQKSVIFIYRQTEKK